MNSNSQINQQQSNCKIIIGTENLIQSEVFYDYYGNSMLDFTSKGLIEGDTVRCERINIASQLFLNSALQTGSWALVDTTNGQTFIAITHKVDRVAETITFKFLNSDKVRHPNVSLESDKIKSIYRVKSTARDLRRECCTQDQKGAQND